MSGVRLYLTVFTASGADYRAMPALRGDNKKLLLIE